MKSLVSSASGSLYPTSPLYALSTTWVVSGRHLLPNPLFFPLHPPVLSKGQWRKWKLSTGVTAKSCKLRWVPDSSVSWMDKKVRGRWLAKSEWVFNHICKIWHLMFNWSTMVQRMQINDPSRVCTSRRLTHQQALIQKAFPCGLHSTACGNHLLRR